MPIYKGEVSVKCTVDVTIEAESLAAAERIAGDIYATSSCPSGVTETSEFSDPISIYLFEDDDDDVDFEAA